MDGNALAFLLKYSSPYSILVVTYENKLIELKCPFKVKVIKNKVAPPFKTAEFDIMYGEGVSKTGEILDLAVEFEIIKKAGSWFSYGDTKLGQGRDAVKALIKDNPELADELEQKIKEYIKENNA